MSLIDLPTSKEYPSAFQQVVPSEDRDFTRSNRGWAVPYPQDSNLSDDIDVDIAISNINAEIEEKEKARIKNFQKLLKVSPFSPKYTGKIDGVKTPALLLSMIGFQNGVNRLTDNSFQIVQGGSIKDQVFNNAIEALKKHKKKTKKFDKEEPVEQTSELVKSYQNLFSQALPLVGKTYSGPIDGEVNDDLIAAAKKVEGNIASFINNNAVNGVVWNDVSKTFNTSPSDVTEALNLIVQHKSNQKTSDEGPKDRILRFSKILLQKS